MSRPTQKIIAVLFAIWLPLFSGSVMAASVAMQVPSGHCQDESMRKVDMDMSDMNMGDMHHMSDPSDEYAPACNACAVCHLACTAYLAVAALDMAAVQVGVRDFTTFQVTFFSVSSTPLLPPPLSRV
ncbi:MAG: DUF2946 family protein [Gallionella sp.]